jgi:hypothetical protein
MMKTIDISPLAPTIKDRLDQLEMELLQSDNQIDPMLIHYFTPGLYAREIYMEKGTLIVSKIHRTRHPFVLSKGSVYVKINEGQWELLEAPYTGITQPGTRRVLYIEEDCIWTTFHPTDIYPEDGTKEAEQRAVAAIDDVIIEKNEVILRFKQQLSHQKQIDGCPS